MIGIKPDDFWRQTWRENALIAEHYHNNINLNWEQTRYISTMIHNSQCQKKSQMIKPHQLFKLPVDERIKKRKSKPQSTEKQKNDFLKKYASMTKKTTLK